MSAMFFKVPINSTKYSLTGHFIIVTLLVLGKALFAFKTLIALIVPGIDSIRCWKQYLEILVHFDITDFLQICQLQIHDENSQLYHITKVLLS